MRQYIHIILALLISTHINAQIDSINVIQNQAIEAAKVSDAATEVLMTKFYTLLTKGKNKREAFDKAVEAVKKEYPSPQYWAAFIMLD